MAHQRDFNIEVVDRYPLISHKGNFSGKASAWIKGFIGGPWWRSDPSTGKVPDTVERNKQFYINQGPVDMSIINAQATSTPISFTNSLVGTFLPRNTLNRQLSQDHFAPRQQKRRDFREQYIWHPFTTKAEEFIEFSIIPTTY